MAFNEKGFLEKIDRQRRREETEHIETELPKVMIDAHERAKREIFNNPDYTIQAPQFIGVYGQEIITRDMREVLRLKNIFEDKQTPPEKNLKMISDVFEAIILMHSELSNWLGDAHTLKTSMYDDFKNKADMYAEWFSPEEGSRVLALGVDVTFSNIGIQEKLTDIRKKIDLDNLGEIKYFRDVRGDFMGTRYNVPRVVLGIQPHVIEGLAKLWMANDVKTLANHPIQHVIANELYTQLTAMSDYAKHNNKHNAHRALEQAVLLVTQLRTEKSAIDIDAYTDDSVANAIATESQSVFAKKGGVIHY